MKDTIRNAIRQLNRWIDLCPFTFLILCITMGAIIGLGVFEGWNGVVENTPIFWILLWFVVGVFVASFLRNRNKLMSCALAGCMVNAQVMGEVAGGLFCWMGENYCPDQPFEPAWKPIPISGAVLQIIVRDGQPQIASIRHIPESEMVSAAEANEELSVQWGLTWTGGRTEQYAVNGLPATAADVPFRYHAGVITLYPDRPQHQLVLEVATRLGPEADWTPLITTSIPADTLIHVEDLTRSECAFYRVNGQQPFQPAAPIALGIGVGLLVGGGYVCYRVAKCAARRARDRQPNPASTNGPPQNPGT